MQSLFIPTAIINPCKKVPASAGIFLSYYFFIVSWQA